LRKIFVFYCHFATTATALALALEWSTSKKKKWFSQFSVFPYFLLLFYHMGFFKTHLMIPENRVVVEKS